MVELLISLFGIGTALGDTISIGPDNWISSGGLYWSQTGWKIQPNQPISLTSVTREAESSVVGIRVYDASKQLLAEASVSGAVASFNPSVPLASGNSYYIVGYATATNNHPRAKYLTLPIQSPALDITVGIDNALNPDGFGSEDPLLLWDIQSIDYAIVPADADGDGVLDAKDQCPNTPAGEVVNAVGCSISQLVPASWPWKNHGEYVATVAHVAGDFVAQGLITQKQKGEIVSAAARSDIGKKR
jgi:hypothetical protein